MSKAFGCMMCVVFAIAPTGLGARVNRHAGDASPVSVPDAWELCKRKCRIGSGNCKGGDAYCADHCSYTFYSQQDCIPENADELVKAGPCKSDTVTCEMLTGQEPFFRKAPTPAPVTPDAWELCKAKCRIGSGNCKGGDAYCADHCSYTYYSQQDCIPENADELVKAGPCKSDTVTCEMLTGQEPFFRKAPTPAPVTPDAWELCKVKCRIGSGNCKGGDPYCADHCSYTYYSQQHCIPENADELVKAGPCKSDTVTCEMLTGQEPFFKEASTPAPVTTAPPSINKCKDLNAFMCKITHGCRCDGAWDTMWEWMGCGTEGCQSA